MLINANENSTLYFVIFSSLFKIPMNFMFLVPKFATFIVPNIYNLYNLFNCNVNCDNVIIVNVNKC